MAACIRGRRTLPPANSGEQAARKNQPEAGAGTAVAPPTLARPPPDVADDQLYGTPALLPDVDVRLDPAHRRLEAGVLLEHLPPAAALGPPPAGRGLAPARRPRYTTLSRAREVPVRAAGRSR